MSKLDAVKKTVAVVGVVLVSAVAMGCAAAGSNDVSFRSAANAVEASGGGAAPTPGHKALKDIASVEVLLDAAPSRPFEVAGEFSTNTLSNSASIEAMREKAAEAGLDGIYWIDCTTSCSGKCTAKGFKYTDVASRNVASR